MFSGAIAADGYILLLERIPHKKAQRAVYFQVTVHMVSFMTVVFGMGDSIARVSLHGRLYSH